MITITCVWMYESISHVLAPCLNVYLHFCFDSSFIMNSSILAKTKMTIPLHMEIMNLIEKECNIVFYNVHDRGGHFAALEQPELLWDDVQAFVEKVWKVQM